LTPLGIFGGTFDPIHFGHLRMAEELRMELELEQVRFIPSALPPHRDQPRASAQDRAAMVALAIAGNPCFALDRRELERDAPSYTVESLLELRGEFGAEIPLMLFIGSDAFFGLPGWHRWRELPALAHIVVACRPGAELREAALAPELQTLWRQCKTELVADLQTAPAGKILWRAITGLDIASSRIREAYAWKISTRYLLPEAVRDYIETHHLYQEKHGI
jgi:nicotinate-nucleotide adenylyltransferase